MLSMLSAFTALPPAFDCVEAGVRGLSVLLTHPVISIVRELVTLRRGGVLPAATKRRHHVRVTVSSNSSHDPDLRVSNDS